MRMEKRVVVGIIVAVIIALLLVNSYALLEVEDNGRPEERAHVAFHLEDSKLFNVSCEIADERSFTSSRPSANPW